MEKPAFKPHIRVAAVAGEGVFLSTERWHRVLRGRLFELVAPLVDGRRRSEDLVEALRQHISPAEVYFVLELLESRGYLLESRERGPVELTAFWTAMGVDPDMARSRLRDAPISITALGRAHAEDVVAALESMGMCTCPDAKFGLVVADSYLDPELEACNREALERRRPWMLLKPAGEEFLLGPVFVPGRTACWKCLHDRYSLNHPIEQFLVSRAQETPPSSPPAASAPGVRQAAVNMAAVALARWIGGGGSSDLEGKLISVDSRTWRTTMHTLVARPRCPACGPPVSGSGRVEPGPVRLSSQRIRFSGEGGYRSVPPEDTLERYEHLVSPITGLVSLVERSPHVGRPLHVYVAAWGENAGHQEPTTPASLRTGLVDNSSGKGLSEAQARASALCEALERRSAAFDGWEPRMTATFEELGEEAVDPRALMLFSANQYHERERRNAGKPGYLQVPEPFDVMSQVEWSPVWSLTQQKAKYVPTAYLYSRYRPTSGQEMPRSFRWCSNGNASGNTIEEAVVQGFLELVERDSVALWWYNMVRRPEVDAAGFDEAGFAGFREYYGRLQRRIWVLDITSDLGIPAFVALSGRTDGLKEEIIMGFGCHLDARLGVQRALAEMNQSLPLVTNGDRRPVCKPGDAEMAGWLETATCANQPYLEPDQGSGIRTSRDYPQIHHADFLDAILECRRAVEARGMEVLVLDQTRVDIGMPAVKVIVPGLRHFWPRFAPGRLYDGPVRLGWLNQPRKESELNPVPVLL